MTEVAAGDEHRFTASLYRWSAQPSFFLLTVPEDVSDEIKKAVRTAEGVDEGDTVQVTLRAI